MNKPKNVREELLFLQKKYGFCNPRKVVEFAKNPNTYLHSKFEWDNTKAAHEYRLWQAQSIIRLELNIIKNDKIEKEVRLFISLRDDRKKEGGYRLMTEVLTNEDLRQKLLNEALAELLRIKNKYEDLIELSKVFAEIDKLQNKKYEISINP